MFKIVIEPDVAIGIVLPSRIEVTAIRIKVVVLIPLRPITADLSGQIARRGILIVLLIRTARSVASSADLIISVSAAEVGGHKVASVTRIAVGVIAVFDVHVVVPLVLIKPLKPVCR